MLLFPLTLFYAAYFLHILKNFIFIFVMSFGTDKNMIDDLKYCNKNERILLLLRLNDLCQTFFY